MLDIVDTVKHLQSRVLAIESRDAGFIHAHTVYFVSAIVFVAGIVIGYLLKP